MGCLSFEHGTQQGDTRLEIIFEIFLRVSDRLPDARVSGEMHYRTDSAQYGTQFRLIPNFAVDCFYSVGKFSVNPLTSDMACGESSEIGHFRLSGSEDIPGIVE